MSLFVSFVVFFVLATYATTFLIRWYALAFLYRDLSRYWSNLAPTFITTTVMLIVVCIILYPLFARFDKISRRIKEGGAKATNEEKDTCLSAYRKVSFAIFLVNFLGFFVGQTFLTVRNILSGKMELFVPLVAMILLQCLGTAVFAAMIEIMFVNELFAPHRRLLEIHTVEEFENRKAMKFSTTTLLLIISAINFCIINTMAVPFHLLTNPVEGDAQTISLLYMKEAFFSAIICNVICIGITYYVLHRFALRIELNIKRVHDIANEGDLTSRLNLAMLDDYGKLTGSINFLIKQLANMFKNLKNDTDVVAKQSDTLSEVTQSASVALVQMKDSFKKIEDDSHKRNTLIASAEKDVLGLTEDVERVKEQVISQTAAVQQTSAAVNEMSANIASVADLTKKADSVSEALSQSSNQGNDAISAAIKSIEEIQTVSLEVQEIVKVIQRIASQTNLLSMNAAIEAAHAGELGQGFAVVADEVRALAQSSSTSAKDVQEKIKDMVEKINLGVDSINVASRSFNEIEENVKQTSTLVRTIASSMEEQQTSAVETLRTTAEMVEAIKLVKELAEHESISAANVRNAMVDVVKSSKDAIELVNEGVEASTHLNDAIKQVNDSVQNNRTAVNSMQETVLSFKV